MGPLALTPNGDGINDALRVEFDLVNVLAARRIGLRIFDLAGRLVWVREEEGKAGGRAWVWDGRGSWGCGLCRGCTWRNCALRGTREAIVNGAWWRWRTSVWASPRTMIIVRSM